MDSSNLRLDCDAHRSREDTDYHAPGTNIEFIVM